MNSIFILFQTTKYPVHAAKLLDYSAAQNRPNGL
jgi:hypothetical protein